MSEHYSFEFHGHKLDPYRILDIYKITNPAQQHAIKKLLRAGRSIKTLEQDIDEVILSLQRWKEMIQEDGGKIAETNKVLRRRCVDCGDELTRYAEIPPTWKFNPFTALWQHLHVSSDTSKEVTTHESEFVPYDDDPITPKIQSTPSNPTKMTSNCSVCGKKIEHVRPFAPEDPVLCMEHWIDHNRRNNAQT